MHAALAKISRGVSRLPMMHDGRPLEACSSTAAILRARLLDSPFASTVALPPCRLRKKTTDGYNRPPLEDKASSEPPILLHVGFAAWITSFAASCNKDSDTEKKNTIYRESFHLPARPHRPAVNPSPSPQTGPLPCSPKPSQTPSPAPPPSPSSP